MDLEALGYCLEWTWTPCKNKSFLMKNVVVIVHLHMTDAVGDFVGDTHISEAFDTFVS